MRSATIKDSTVFNVRGWRVFYYNYTVWQFFTDLILADFQKIPKSAKKRDFTVLVDTPKVIQYVDNMQHFHAIYMFSENTWCVLFRYDQ